MSGKIMQSDEMRLRVTQLEYENLTKEEYQKEIKRIYTEEYGEKLPADIKVYPSSAASGLKNDASGYEGTAVHFQSYSHHIDELYIISQGTDNAQDWEYNINAMLAGQDAAQANATKTFIKDAKRYFKVGDGTLVIGLSHSLSLNNNATAHLMNDGKTFDDIYGVNGAQTNYYQLYNNDKEFHESVKNKFSIDSFNEEAVYDIKPDKLKSFAEDYYKEQGKDIHQIISKDDPLFAVSDIRGFFTLGDVDPVDTNPGYPGLRDIMKDISDKDVKEIQDLAIQYAKATKDGDWHDGVQDLTGINVDLVNNFQDHTLSTYATQQEELDQMVHDMDEKIPVLLTQVKKVTANSDKILQKFVDAGYIDSNQKDTTVRALTDIQGELEEMEDTISTWNTIRELPISAMYDTGISKLSANLGADYGAYRSIVKKHKTALLDSMNQLKQIGLVNIAEMIKGDHSISKVLKAKSNGNKSYKGNEMFMTGTSDSKKIEINLSAAMRVYKQGNALLEDKREKIDKLALTVEREIKDYYKQEKRKVLQQIDDMEANPKAYHYLLEEHFPLLSANKEIKRIRVDEVIEPLKHADMDDHIEQLYDSVEKGKAYLQSYRSSIERIFDTDEHVAAMFDVVGEM